MREECKYKKMGEFILNGEAWVSVRILNTGTALTMPLKEWKRVYGNLHPERWKKNCNNSVNQMSIA